jgi:hypothetical protein
VRHAKSWISAVLACAGCAWVSAFPSPSPFPITWELKFDVGLPTRVVVLAPGDSAPKAYWYLTYTVANRTGRELTFLPFFEMLTENGTVTRSDRLIPPAVFATIQQREGKQFLEPALRIAGELRIGDDQMRDGVAIWPEATPNLGHFTIFASGFSGESTTLPAASADAKATILRKTLQLDYVMAGDGKFAENNLIEEVSRAYIMR